MNFKRFKAYLGIPLFILILTGCGVAGLPIEEPAPVSAFAGHDSNADEQTEVALTASGHSNTGTSVSFQWTQVDGTAVTLSDAERYHTTFITPTVVEVEALTFEVKVSDAAGNFAIDQVVITVNPVNLDPSVDAGSSQLVGVGTEVTLQGVAADSDGTIESYQWTQIGGETVELENADSEVAKFIAPASAKDLTFSLTVTDNEGAQASDEVSISVRRVFLQHDQGAQYHFAPGTELKFTVAGYKVEQQSLSWSLITDAPLALSSVQEEAPEPTEVSFTTLPVAADTEVTVRVVVTEQGVSETFESTIVMQPQGNFAYSSSKLIDEAVVFSDEPQQLASVDLTGDGYADLLSILQGKVRLLVNKGETDISEGKRFESSVIINTEHSVSALEFADINKDERQDLVLIGNNTISWLVNGEGSNDFGPEVVLSLPQGASQPGAKVADMDNDGDADIVVVYRDGSNGNKLTLGWFKQANDGGFADLKVLDNNFPTDMLQSEQAYFSLGDFNNDEFKDIILGSPTAGDIRPVLMYLNGGSAENFSKSTAFELDGDDLASYTTKGIFNIDINLDGLDDVVTWQSGTGDSGPHSLSKYFINNGDGRFNQQDLAAFNTTKLKLSQMDVDGDGDMDLIQGIGDSYGDCHLNCIRIEFNAGRLIWHENNSGTISPDSQILGNSATGFIFDLGDLDNDNDVDVVNLNQADDKIWIYQKH